MIKRIRIIAAALLLAASVMAITAASVSANGGPHEGVFSITTDACAGCHRIHTAQSDPLLRADSQYNLCMSCHDGSGSALNAKDGVYLGNTSGIQNAGLKGGGFENALMNVALDPLFNETGVPQPITSRHSVGASNVLVWGSGNVTTNGSYGATITDLECANCHNPHGNSNYRMLRPRPVGGAYVFDGWNGTAFQASVNRTITNITSNVSGSLNYTQVYEPRSQTAFGTNTSYLRRARTAMYTGFSGNISNSAAGNVSSYNSTSPLDDWCSQCHTRYIQANGYTNTLHTDNDPLYKYSHYTGSTGGCFMCHVAHGTPATMTGYANGLNPYTGNTSTRPLYANGTNWPDGVDPQAWQIAPETSQTSRLLVGNNRGACIQCHSSVEANN